MTANKTTDPRIVSVEFHHGKIFNAIHTWTSDRAVITWSNGSKTVAYDEAARATYNNWRDEQEAAA